MAHMKDLSGQRFGSRVAIKPMGKRMRAFLWLVRCDCGREDIVEGSKLSHRKADKCGTCKQLEHGHRVGATSTPEYSTWLNMLQRCSNPKSRDYHNYGGRGIRVCLRWLSFSNFLEDMGPKPRGLTLERRDNNGNYEFGNCKWATRLEQRHNQREHKKRGS